MKKCPKCGTILDDSKVKCYVCGTDLQRQTLTNFGNSFNEKIGASVSNNQGNVLNNSNSFQGVNVNQVNGSIASNSNFSNSVYNNQLNNLNSMAYDDRTALEKMFSSDDRFKSKAEINAANAMKNNQKRNSFADAFNNSMNTGTRNANSNNVSSVANKQGNNRANTQMPQRMPQQQMSQQQMPANRGMMNQQQMPGNNMPNNRGAQPQLFTQKMMQNKAKQNVKKPSIKDKVLEKVNGLKAKKQKNANNTNVVNNTNNKNNISNNSNLLKNNKNNDNNQKPAINWGNDLVNENNKGNFKKTGGFKINSSMVFNIVALIIAIVGVLFVYFKFIKSDSNGKVYTLNGLKYSISNNFKLKDDQNNFRLYTYGEYCSIGLSYGPTNAVSTYIDDLYEKIRSEYDMKYFKISKSTAKYNNNVWTEINVVSLASNASSANGYTTQTKIQYVSIIYEGNYYTVAYQNTNNNTICSASYDGFLKTLAFK